MSFILNYPHHRRWVADGLNSSAPHLSQKLHLRPLVGVGAVCARHPLCVMQQNLKYLTFFLTLFFFRTHRAHTHTTLGGGKMSPVRFFFVWLLSGWKINITQEEGKPPVCMQSMCGRCMAQFVCARDE